MDTDDLTDEAYNSILGEAEKFNSDLTLQFGLLSYECSGEAEFIKKSVFLINSIKQYDEMRIYDIFFGNPPPMDELQKTLNKILSNISALKTKL